MDGIDVDIDNKHKDKKSFRHSMGNFLQSLSRRLKAGIYIYWGQYGTPMPYPAEISFVFGDPILPVPGPFTLGGDEVNHLVGDDYVNGPGSSTKKMCTKIPDPSDEQIEELMNRYVDANERLFEQYKDQAGYNNVILKAI